ncbi:hypothetical protein MD484_g4777, partial [Candolleomyces efflorescens]
MASTQWDTLQDSPASPGTVREEDLKEFWTVVLAQGAVYKRVEDPTRDAREIIDHILEKHAAAIQIQRELVELDKRVVDTQAAKTIKETLGKWLAAQ